MKYYHAFDKKTLEYKTTLEWIPDRTPGDHFIPTDSPDPLRGFDNEKCVYVNEIFGVESKKYEFISIKEFKELQIHLKNDDPLGDTQKIDEDGNRVSKTKEELLEEGHYSREEIISSVQSKLKNDFAQALKTGVIHKGYRFDCTDESKTRVADAILEAKTFPEDLIPFWVSTCKVDENGVDLPNTENAHFPIATMEDLLELGKAIKDKWKSTFYDRRLTLDSLPSLTDEELHILFLEN
jgi:hypothetical protein